MALDQIQPGVDLVRAVDGELDVGLEPDQVDTDLASQTLRFLGRRHPAHAKPIAHARAQGTNERAGRTARAQADHVAGLDEAEDVRGQRR